MQHDDVELVQRTLDGDDNAFAELVKKYQDQIHSLAWQKIGDFHIAQEITQDTFITAYQKLTTLKHRNRLAGWLYVIANNKCNMWHRKKKPQPQSLEETDPVELEETYYSDYLSQQREEATKEKQRALVKRLLSKLQESDKTVITLYYLAGLSCEEIGRFLGVSTNTVKSRLHRARNRMRKEKTMIQENLSSFQLPQQLTENIMKKISHLNPTSPTGGKPFVPWVIPTSAAILIFLLVGTGMQFLYRFQKPYSLNAQSEQTIELVDTKLIIDSDLNPSMNNQIGRTETSGENVGSGQHQETTLLAAAEADELPILKSDRQWVHAKGPEGGAVINMFATSRGDMYAGTLTGLYRLSDDGTTWQLINTGNVPSLIAQKNGTGWGHIGEHGKTIYLATGTEILASTDRGETWKPLGKHPGGIPFGLLITDGSLRTQTDVAIYLALTKRSEWNNQLETAIFRSIDNGATWELISNEDIGNEIRGIAGIDNTVFAATNIGLFRLNIDGWEQLSVGNTEFMQGDALAIRALTTTDDQLYVVIEGQTKPKAIARINIENSKDDGHQQQAQIRKPKVVRSIKPKVNTDVEFPPPIQPNIVPVQTFSGWILYRSNDKGISWEYLSSKETIMNRKHTRSYSPLPSEGPRKRQFPFALMGPETNLKIAARGEKILLIEGEDHSISIDGGNTWTAFYLNNNSYSGGNASAVVMLNENTYYRSGAYGIFRTDDAGKSWHKFNKGLSGITILTLASVENRLYATTPIGFLTSNDGGDTWKPLFEFENESYSSDGSDIFTNIVKSNGILYFRADETTSSKEPKRMKPFFLRISVKDNDIGQIPGLPDSNKLEAVLPGGFSFAVSDDTFYMEYKQRLFRWKKGTTKWHDTGLIDTQATTSEELNFDVLNPIGFKLAVSHKTVYAGLRNGQLFQSFDEGNTWKNITSKLPLTVEKFKDIGFAGKTVYIATGKGVVRSNNGTDWQLITDKEGTQLIVDRFAEDGIKLYAQAHQKVYRLDENSHEIVQITPEIPYLISCLDIDGNTLYVGTLGNGVLRYSLDE